jgi:hypothetical protein
MATVPSHNTVPSVLSEEQRLRATINRDAALARRAANALAASAALWPQAPAATKLPTCCRGQVLAAVSGVSIFQYTSCLAVFTPAAVAALLFTAVVVLLLASATFVADKQIMGVW